MLRSLQLTLNNMSPAMRLVSIFCLVSLILVPTFSRGQEATPRDSTQLISVDSVEAGAIRISDLADQTGITVRRLRAAAALSEPNPEILEIDTRFAAAAGELAALQSETNESLSSDASQEQLDELQRRWRVQIRELETWEVVLGERIEKLNQEGSELQQERDPWALTRSVAARDEFPASLLGQIDTVLVSIDRVNDMLRRRFDAVLELEGQVTRANLAAVKALESLGKVRSEVMTERLSRLGTPLWRLFSGESDPVDTSQLRIVEGAKISGRYLTTQLGSLGIHIGLFLALLISFRSLGVRLSRLAAEDKTLEAPARTFEKYALPAALISLIATPAIYPFPPNSLIGFATIFSIPLTIYLLLHQLPKSLHHMLHGLGAIVLLWVVARILVPVGSNAERLGIFAVEVVGLISATWFLRPGGTTDILESSRVGRIVISTCRAGLIILLVSLVADVLGYVELAHHGTKVSMIGIYMGLYFYVGALICVGGAAAFLHTRLAQRSRAIRAHTPLLQSRITKFIFIGASIYWLVKVIQALGAFDPLLGALSDILSRPWGIGDVQISIIDILAFVITLWISLRVAQIIRAILDEDILGRMELPRGLPIAISGLTFYFLVASGIAVALSAAGVPLDRLALLTGALGIGIGFGLQDVVRNFISGLILMVERPIKVGDTIEFGSQAGTIMKIGIRASVVRAFDGVDVIVPNGHLVTNEVKNWTMADNARRIDVDLTVSYDADPKQVTEILLAVAGDYGKIAADPAPAVVFTGFGDRGMKFSLRCWVDEPDGWVGKRTEMSFEAHRRLTEAGIEFPVVPIPGAD
ncbi:mechanosensitive ion channel family protein [Bacteroidota bacterium]